MVTSDWYEKEYEEAFVNKVKKKVREKNKKIGYNNLTKELKIRWIGDLCEDTFNDWLDSVGMEHDWLAKESSGIDEIDFEVGSLTIDVKGIATSYYPKMHYAAHVNADQWKKIIKNGKINTLVFGRFIFPVNTAVIVGWLPVHEFENKMRFLKEGTKLSNGIIVNTDMYDVKINQLRPILEIDRWS